MRLQEDYQCYYFVADWHALTTEYETPGAISGFIPEMVTDWLSVGLDPLKSTIFVQSAIPEHCELYLVFGMFTPVPWLERNPTYKEQLREQTTRDLQTYGFLGYPVLQAADILLPDALLDLDGGGVQVDGVEGAAANAGIRAGDLILSLNNVEIQNARQFNEVASKVDVKKNVAALNLSASWTSGKTPPANASPARWKNSAPISSAAA